MVGAVIKAFIVMGFIFKTFTRNFKFCGGIIFGFSIGLENPFCNKVNRKKSWEIKLGGGVGAILGGAPRGVFLFRGKKKP